MIVELSEYSFEYKTGIKTLEIPSLKINVGEKIALVGRNGSGKSTLLHCLSGVFDGSSGKRVCTARPEQVALAFQSPCLDKKLTVRENLSIFGKVWGLSSALIKQRTNELAQMLELEPLLNHTVGNLSGGQQRRADLARALLSEPQILFLDEPTTGLDVVAQREFWSLLSKTKNHNPKLTIICASHHTAELGIFDRFLFLEQGRIELDTQRSELLAKLPPETVEIATFQPENMKQLLRTHLAISATEPTHNKILVHVDGAERLVAQLKLHQDILNAIESTTVRKTTLADVVVQQLLGDVQNISLKPTHVSGGAL